MAGRNSRPNPPGDRRNRLTVSPSASPQEAAAIVAAIERFMRATGRPAAPTPKPPDGWRRAAILEGVTREQEPDALDPWINT
jgi:hypothetical protein